MKLTYNFLKRKYTKYLRNRIKRKFKKAMHELITHSTTCIDVGAHTGSITELMLHAQKIIAIEPQWELCYVLDLKFKNNSKVKIMNCAVSSEIGKITLYVNERKRSISTVSKEFADERRQEYFKTREIPTTTLAKIFKENNLTDQDNIYIKIDAENHEREILSTLPFLVTNLSFEIHWNNKEKLLDCLKILDSFNENYICNILINRQFIFKKFVAKVKVLDYVLNKKNKFVADIFVQKALEVQAK